MEWHTWQERLLHDVGASLWFAIKACARGFFHHLLKIRDIRKWQKFLADAHCLCHDSCPLPLMNVACVTEAEKADMAGQSAMNLVFVRLFRCLNLVCGRPHLVTGILRNVAYDEAFL